MRPVLVHSHNCGHWCVCHSVAAGSCQACRRRMTAASLEVQRLERWLNEHSGWNTSLLIGSGGTAAACTELA